MPKDNIAWIFDMQEGDILLFQENMRVLLAVFGISQKSACTIIGVSTNSLTKFLRMQRVMSPQQYAQLRMHMQVRVKNDLQKQALFYLTHRSQNARIVQEKTEEIYHLIGTFTRVGPESAKDYAVTLSQLWLQLGRKKEA